ncbi:hypothetical protein GCM10027046_13830 [Uliginosibacterium flavum]|uniref:Glycosyltransferase family 4 protein n=1 Tax=Uliginosibacterium flavum TaxID=1396831 RepID=A0ABV2TQV5_9RHOO
MSRQSVAADTVILLSHGFQAEYEAGIANGLARNGLNVVLVGSDSTLYERLDPSIRALNLRGCHDPQRSRFQKVWNLVRYFFSYQYLLLTTPHAAVHLIGQFTTNRPLLFLAEMLVTRVVARRVWLTVHNVMPHEKHTRFNHAVHRCLYALPHELVVHTERTRQRLAELFALDGKRVRVLEHGIARFPDFDAVARDRIRARLGLGPTDRLLLFFGNLGLYKGPDLLIEAFGRLPAEAGWHLHIAGRCRHADLRRQMDELIAGCPHSPRIHWEEGYVADDEVPAFFFAADALALPYRHIDQSGVLFMAMATGLPVIASDVGSFREYVAAHAGAIVPPEDVTALASAIEQFVPLDESERRLLAERARRFDWALTARSLCRAYHPTNPEEA